MCISLCFSSCMKKIDARSLNQDVQEVQNLQIVRLRESGRSNKETAEIVGVSQAHSSNVWQRYRNKARNHWPKASVAVAMEPREILRQSKRQRSRNS